MGLILFCTALMVWGFGFNFSRQEEVQTESGEIRSVLRKKQAVYLVAVLVIISTLRYGFVDTYAYKEMYRLSRHNYGYVFSGAGWEIETGWLFLNYCLNFISESPKLILFLSALIINLAWMKLSQEYSENACFSFFLYFCLMYLDTNNGLRQMVAAAVTMLGFPLYLKKKYIWFALLIGVAYQFHNSAIVWFIIAVAVMGKPFNIRTVAALLLGVLFLFIPEVLTGIIDTALEDNQYNYYLDKRGGMRFARALVTGIIPAVLCLVHYFQSKVNRTEIPKEEAVLMNLTIINTMFILMGTYMQYWNRFAFYTFFAPIILLPKLIRSVFSKNLRSYRAFRAVVIILYFLYFSYNIYSNSGLPGAGSDALEKFYIEWWC